MQMTWFLAVLVVAVGSAGIIQYAKGFLPKVPSFVWGIALPVLCAAGSIALEPWPMAVAVFLLGLALAQIGYETLIQGVISAIDSATGANIQPPKAP